MTGGDLAVVAGQLGRRPHPISRVVRRCPFDLPAVVETLPADAAGRPFPTLFYATCPTLVAAVGTLESAGGVRRFELRLREDTALARSVQGAVWWTRRRRRELVAAFGLSLADGGASLRTGIAGVTDSHRLKCLHAHAAHALARPGYLLGEGVLAEAGALWCDDGRCATWAKDARCARGGRALDAGRCAASHRAGRA